MVNNTLPFHSEEDEDQKLLFSMTCGTLLWSLPMTVGTTETKEKLSKCKYSIQQCFWNILIVLLSLGIKYILFPPSSTAVVATITSMTKTRSITHPTYFLLKKIKGRKTLDFITPTNFKYFLSRKYLHYHSLHSLCKVSSRFLNKHGKARTTE